MASSPYAQRCGLAKALELVGERWTLLVLRELIAGPRRYKDLLRGIPGVATNVLSTRLRTLEDWRVIRQRRLGPPASVDVYELDEEGIALVPALRELTRWGLRHLDPDVGELEFRSSWLVLAMQALFEPSAPPPDADITISFELDDEILWARIRGGELESGLGEVDAPEVRIIAPRELFLDVAEGRLTFDEALSRGASLEGDVELAMLLPRLFPATREREAA